MHTSLLQQVYAINPWLKNPSEPILKLDNYVERVQSGEMLLPDWDRLWLILTGPRRTGKTVLGKWLSQNLINAKRFSNLLYLNCDYLEIRRWLENQNFIHEALQHFLSYRSEIW